MALVRPAAKLDDVEVVAVAARDRTRAERFAAKHGIGRVHDDYAALLADPDVDAVYNPLPNGLHAPWTVAALEAGKHVLCEKPFASNEAEAREVAAVADGHPSLVVMEAVHYRYHPFAARLAEICRSGELGELEQIDTWMCVPVPKRSDIRYDIGLAGGATMDVGCYAVHLARLLAAREPRVTWAKARVRVPEVDRTMEADVEFAGGTTGTVRCSLWSGEVLTMGARVRGSAGSMEVRNVTVPHLLGRAKVRVGGRTRIERPGPGRTYDHQLRAFADAVLRGGPVLTPPSDSIATMAVIDAMYRAAGLEPRGT